MTDKLQRIDRAAAAIERATTVAEAKEARAQVAAIEKYFKEHKDKHIDQNRLAKLKLRADRKLGELIPMEFPRGGTGSNQHKKKQNAHAVRLADIGINTGFANRCRKIASIPEKDFEGALAELMDGEIMDELTTSAILKLSKRLAAARKPRIPKQERGAFVTKFEDLLKLEPFACIYADPPWKYDNQGTRASTNNHYPTLTVDQICALPVGKVAAENAHLHLWTTNGFLFECPRILEAWGFTFKSTFVWVKPKMGIGNYWRNSHEILLLAVKGKLTAQNKSLMSWMQCERGQHSAKPDKVRELVEELSPSPRLELFGRRPVPGWVVFGNEITSML